MLSGVLINHDIGFREAHGRDFSMLAKDAVFGAGQKTQPIILRVHRLTQGNAAYPRISCPANSDSAVVRRTSINAGRSGRVGRKLCVLRVSEIKRVGVIRVAAVVIEESPYPPRAGGSQIVPHELVVVIVRIQDPGGDELLEVAEAHDPFRFLLGSGQGRQQQRRENRDNGNDDQQLDQSEGATLTRFHTGSCGNGSRWPCDILSPSAKEINTEFAACRGKFKRRFVGGTKGDSVRGRIFRGYRASGGVEAGAGEALPRTGFGEVKKEICWGNKRRQR